MFVNNITELNHLVAGRVWLRSLHTERGRGLDVDQPAVVRVEDVGVGEILGRPRRELLVFSRQARVNLTHSSTDKPKQPNQIKPKLV